jgi:hypothetical protein
MYRQRSIILNRPSNNPRQRPRFLESYDFSLRGLQQMLDDRLNKETGSLREYRETVKRHLEEWRKYSKCQVKKLPEPIGSFAEQIHRSRAKVAVCEQECRTLQQMIKLEVEKAQSAKTIRGRKPRAKGVMKYRGGDVASCDGREVKSRDGDGELIFVDDGSLVSQYLESLAQAKRAGVAQKIAQRRALNEALRKAREEVGKDERTPAV